MRNLIVAVSFFCLAGCYTTKLVAPQVPAGPPQSERQWFTVAGLIPLSQPAGQQCTNGFAYSKSSMAGTDILINVGLTLAGGLAGSSMCNLDAGPAAYSTCVSTYSTLVPFLLSSRTLNYACVQPR